MIRTACLGMAILAGLAGCSSSNSNSGSGTPGNTDLLEEVRGLIGMYSGEHKKAPRSLADCTKYEAGYPLGFAAVKKGDIVVIWGVKMIVEEGGGSPQGTTDIVAYEKKTPTEGGSVLLHNGTVKTVTADEFKAAPKAKS